MKKLLLILLICSFQIMIGQQYVDVRLVNENIGTANCCNYDNSSNDSGLNIILQAHNVTRYIGKEGHPYPPFAGKMIEITCNCDANLLVNDLNAYSTVVDKAVVSNFGIFKDAVTVKILNDGIGIPTGVNNSIITTNDDGLNQIFKDFNVFYYDHWCTTCGNIPSLAKAYNIVCDCDNTGLKIALDNYTSVIEITEYTAAYYPLLGNMSFENSTKTIYPNPFSTTFSINATENISEYSVFDSSGKKIIKSNSKSDLDTQTSGLVSGIYLLKLQFENGKNTNYKLIKK